MQMQLDAKTILKSCRKNSCLIMRVRAVLTCQQHPMAPLVGPAYFCSCANLFSFIVSSSSYAVQTSWILQIQSTGLPLIFFLEHKLEIVDFACILNKSTNQRKLVIAKPPDPVIICRGRSFLCLNVGNKASRPPVIALQSAPN